MKKESYSKKICSYSLISFSIVIVLSMALSFFGINTEVFAYLIPSVGAVAAASVIFYYNKAKTENLSKQRLRNVLLKLVVEEKLSPEDFEEILAEIEYIDDTIDSKLSSMFEQAIDEEPEIEI
jgi:uncharacterized membrane protein